MARNYANISTAIWRREDDFTDLSVHAQWAYLMLVSQPDISAAGVLSINLRRWTGRAKDSSRELLVAALKELADTRYLVYDQDTEELLVRTFVKWDGGYANRKRQPVIRSAALEIESAKIRRALAAELAKLGFTVDGLTDGLPDSLSGSVDSPSDGASRAVANAHPERSPSRATEPIDADVSSQGNSLSDRQSRSDRVVVTGVVPPTTSLNPHSSPPAAGGAGGSATPKAKPDRGTRLPEDWKPDEHLHAWLAERKLGGVALSSLIDLDVEIEKFRNHWLAKTGKDATKRAWGRTFQNWLVESGQRAQRYARNGTRDSPASTAPKPIPAAERCPDHPSYNRDRCGPCRSERGATSTNQTPRRSE